MQRAAILILIRRFFFCSLFTCILATNFPANVTAEEQPANTTSAADTAAPENNAFTYELTGRPDPFVPFIEPKVATKLDEVVDDDVELTGMQLFEPGQLQLVAVLVANDKKIAMVEDVTGKGYVINEGILVGKYGIVSQITTDQVIITETKRTRAGKEITNTVVMRLKKDGDK